MELNVVSRGRHQLPATGGAAGGSAVQATAGGREGRRGWRPQRATCYSVRSAAPADVVPWEGVHVRVYAPSQPVAH